MYIAYRGSCQQNSCQSLHFRDKQFGTQLAFFAAVPVLIFGWDLLAFLLIFLLILEPEKINTLYWKTMLINIFFAILIRINTRPPGVEYIKHDVRPQKLEMMWYCSVVIVYWRNFAWRSRLLCRFLSLIVRRMLTKTRSRLDSSK